MYWDIIEVKPEPDYRLFVRFKDGLAGRVQLRREELTGALAPLLDVKFFEQVFIDGGAVAWPGEIDLAPDAMYAQLTSRSQLPRVYELKDLLCDPYHPDAYFQNFEDHLRDTACFAAYASWEKVLQGLDPAAWLSLKHKAAAYVDHMDKKGRGRQQLFDVFSEALAYNYLRQAEVYSIVRFIPESNGRTPDLEGTSELARELCEVKTMNISDDEVRARGGPPASRKAANPLDGGFFRKLDSDIACAKSQLQSYDPSGAAEHLVYIHICFDDFFCPYQGDYLRQIKEHLLKQPPGIKVVVSFAFSKTETHVVAQ
jgi:hypothetical protein